MLLVSLLLTLQSDAIRRLEADDIEVRTVARQELIAQGPKAFPALRAAGTVEALSVVDAVLYEAERAFRGPPAAPLRGCGRIVHLDAAEARRWTRELEPLFPGCRLRAARVDCMRRRLCDDAGLWIYAVAEDDAEVFTIRKGHTFGDALLCRLAPVPGREQEVARTLAGGYPSRKLIFDAEGRLIRIGD